MFSMVLLSELVLYFTGIKDKVGRKHLNRVVATFPFTPSRR